MCEPFGSIVQYPEHDDHGTPVAEAIKRVIVEPQNIILPPSGIVIPHGSSIGRHLHFARLGKGHSETQTAVFGRNTNLHLLPADTKYEASWWNRKFRTDGRYNGVAFEAADAFESAQEYANRIALGHIRKLRNFLEISILNTDVPYLYFDRSKHLLNSKAWLDFEKKISYALGKGASILDIRGGLDADLKRQVISALIGLLRNRKNVVPEWADVSSLWD